MYFWVEILIVESNIDRNHIDPHMPSRKQFTQMVETNLCDVWRCLNGNLKQYTCTHARDNRLSLARLDRLYCFKHHLSIFKNCFITSIDHSLVIGTVTLNFV